MTLYEDDRVTMEAPDGWVNRTVVTWVEPLPPGHGHPAKVMLTRDAAAPTDTLENRTVWAVRQIVDLPELALHERTPISLNDETPAVQLFIEWTHPSGRLTELVTLFLRGGTFWTFTATIPTARLDELDPLMQEMLGSFTVGDGSAGGER